MKMKLAIFFLLAILLFSTIAIAQEESEDSSDNDSESETEVETETEVESEDGLVEVKTETKIESRNEVKRPLARALHSVISDKARSVNDMKEFSVKRALSNISNAEERENLKALVEKRIEYLKTLLDNAGIDSEKLNERLEKLNKLEGKLSTNLSNELGAKAVLNEYNDLHARVSLVDFAIKRYETASNKFENVNNHWVKMLAKMNTMADRIEANGKNPEKLNAAIARLTVFQEKFSDQLARFQTALAEVKVQAESEEEVSAETKTAISNLNKHMAILNFEAKAAKKAFAGIISAVRDKKIDQIPEVNAEAEAMGQIEAVEGYEEILTAEIDSEVEATIEAAEAEAVEEVAVEETTEGEQ